MGGRADQSAPSSTLWNARVKEAAVAQGILFNFAGSNTCFYNNSLHPEADSDTCALTCSSHTTSSRHRTTRRIHFATAKEGNSANVFLVWRRDARMCRENWLRIAPRLQSETRGRNTRARMDYCGEKSESHQREAGRRARKVLPPGARGRENNASPAARRKRSRVRIHAHTGER